MNNLDMNWQKTLSLFQGKLDDYGLDKITFDSFFTTLEIKDIVGSVVTITIDTKWSLDVVEPYLTHLQEIYNTVTNGHYQLHLMTEEEILANFSATDEKDPNVELTLENYSECSPSSTPIVFPNKADSAFVLFTNAPSRYFCSPSRER